MKMHNIWPQRFDQADQIGISECAKTQDFVAQPIEKTILPKRISHDTVVHKWCVVRRCARAAGDAMYKALTMASKGSDDLLD